MYLHTSDSDFNYSYRYIGGQAGDMQEDLTEDMSRTTNSNTHSRLLQYNWLNVTEIIEVRTISIKHEKEKRYSLTVFVNVLKYKNSGKI